MRDIVRLTKISVPQLFTTLWLGLGFAETPITADKREIKGFPKLSLATSYTRKPLGELGRNVEEVDIHGRR
jgi:hypothetical protein